MARLNTRAIISYCLVLASAGCIDRITFPMDNIVGRVVISGHISTAPGPYTIKVSEGTDIQSPFVFSKPISVKHLVLMDNQGNVDTLTDRLGEVGTYYTHENGIRGVAGRAYKVWFETLDQRIYESVYDTIREATGSLDDIYTAFVGRTDLNGKTTYGFNMHFNSSGIATTKNRYMWRLVTTYKVETDPKNHRAPCGGAAPDCPNQVVSCGCASPLPCSGYTYGQTYPDIVSIGPCTCCTCWATLVNESPVLYDLNLYNGRLTNAVAGFIPISEFTFMFKAYSQVEQHTISQQTYACFKSILNQQSSAGSLFQPTIGKIAGNIIQISGTPIPAEGLFYATTITSKGMYISRYDVPNQRLLIQYDTMKFANKRSQGSCLDFPNSTTEQPSFWVD